MSNSKNMIFFSISYIESRLSDELSINELAGHTFFSKPHYQRLFQAVIGESVMEYIRKRRLLRASIMLCETEVSVLEIALQFGYSSHEGFSRAFKEYFGMTPLQYRKRYASTKSNSNHEEVISMISNETRKSILRYADDIATDWEVLTAKLEKLIAPAKNEIEKSGLVAGGMKVSFQEWSNLTARMGSATNETRKLFAETTDVYELYDKADALMVMLDDIIFQMNLLRFLTGVEWSRMGQHGIPFEPIVEGITALCETESERKESAIKLILEINTLIQLELKLEAVNCMHQAAEAMREIVKEGAFLTEKLNALAINLGAYGRGFSLVAKEAEKATSCVRDIERIMQQLAEKDDKKDSAVFTVDEINSVDIAIKQLADTAFKMNINGFNASVETARAGNEHANFKYAEDIRDYAWKLQCTYKKCVSLNKDCIKLISLYRNEDKKSDTNHFDKELDDILFQSELLTTQLCLESERTRRDDLISLSHEFQKDLDDLKRAEHRYNQAEKVNILKKYSKNLSALIKSGNTTAIAAGNHGSGIAYILKEFILFSQRIDTVLKNN